MRFAIYFWQGNDIAVDPLPHPLRPWATLQGAHPYFDCAGGIRSAQTATEWRRLQRLFCHPDGASKARGSLCKK